MNLPPILAALRKHKAGTVLIALQIALTLGIVCNAVYIIGQRIQRIDRPTGLDERNLLLVSQQLVGAPSPDTPAGLERLDAMLLEDLATLRALPGVESVSRVNSVPLLNNSWNGSVNDKPGLKRGFTMSTFYFGDEQMLKTFGAHLIAGRFFNAQEIEHRSERDLSLPPVVVISRALAHKLFGDAPAVGKTIYMNGGTTPSRVIGVVDRLQTSSTSSWADGFTWYSTMVPRRLDSNSTRYAIRTRPGQLQAVMREVGPALYKLNPMRVLDDKSVKSFAEIRQQAYRADLGMAVLMGIVCTILLGVTAAGIVGLTSFWVGQRYRQIGVRRALGARKADILRYFQIENLLIAGAGAVVGTLLALGINLWLIQRYAMSHLPIPYVVCGVAAVMLLGQAAVFAPARRASNVSPVVATRSV